ncbi:MAG: CoA transferase, partial [Desulfobacteraceae bacterium]|nr:CoA transferase [Desulfobacteraceae bacterium]
MTNLKTKKLHERALDGVKVLEYCSMVSGPYCAKIMADLGAEVIKIEPPVDGDPARRM